MRILNFEKLKKEMEHSRAFNLALLRAIDPRLITRRPRDPEKARLMRELGMESSVPETTEKSPAGTRKSQKRKSRGMLPDVEFRSDFR